MSLTTSVRLAVAAKLTNALDLGEAVAPVSADYSLTLANGVAAGQADRVFADTRTLAASASEDLDLAGTLLDPLGAALTFARVKALIVRAAPGNTNNVVIGNAASNAWAALLGATGTAVLRPGAALAVVAGTSDANGYAVTASTGDLLKVANSGGVTPVTYDIVVIGASA